MYSNYDLDKANNIEFKKRCMSEGISESLVHNTLGILSYIGVELFIYTLDFSPTPYYLINDGGVKLQCGKDSIHHIIKYAIDDVVREMEYELKENVVLKTKEGIESESMLSYCGNILDSMIEGYTNYLKDSGKEEELVEFTKECRYYNNLITIALTDYTK